MYFVNRNFGDAVYGLLSIAAGMPEVLGEVDDATLTHGFVVARVASINQTFMSPRSVTEHELFHLLGCAKHFDMPECYRRIQSLKREEIKLADRGYFEERGEEPFYPTYASLTDSMLLSRAQVNGYPLEEPTNIVAAAAP
jgi:hypothetical protein